MGNIQHYNALLYEKHKGLVDDLASEGRALRRELVESCKAFAKAMPETVTDELRKEAFDLFMRDVHIAHVEFQKRLGSLCDGQHESEIERLNTEKNKLNNLIADLRGKLEQQKKENESIIKTAGELLNKIGKAVKSFDDILKELDIKINDLIKNAQDIEHNKHLISSPEVISAIEEFREVTRMLEKYRKDHIESMLK